MRPRFPSLMDRYIASLMVVPLLATLAISLILLILDKLLRLLDFIVVQAGPPSLVWQLLINTVPAYLSFSIVLALLMSVALTFRRLALSSELDVLCGAGVSYSRMLLVPICFAVTLAAVHFALLGFVQPQARYAYRQVQFALVSGALGARIRVGEFAKLGRSSTLRAERVSGKRLRHVFVKLHAGRTDIAISAERAVFLADPTRTAMVMRLHDGILVESIPSRPLPRVLSYSSYDLLLPSPVIGGLEHRGGELDELTVSELADAAGPPASRSAALAQLNFRLAQVATLLLLPFLGLALAVPPKRSSSFLGVLVAVVLLVLWYKVLQFSLAQALIGKISPLFGIWLPFAGFLSLTAWLYLNFARGRRPTALRRVATFVTRCPRIGIRALRQMLERFSPSAASSQRARGRISADAQP